MGFLKFAREGMRRATVIKERELASRHSGPYMYGCGSIEQDGWVLLHTRQPQMAIIYIYIYAYTYKYVWCGQESAIIWLLARRSSGLY